MSGGVSGAGSRVGGFGGPDEAGTASGAAAAADQAGAAAADSVVQRGSAPGAGAAAGGLDASMLRASLDSWRLDSSAVSKITAEGLDAPMPRAGLVPAERKLHADIEKSLYAARGDVAVGTLVSRATYETNVARNRTAVNDLKARANDMASKYETEASAAKDPNERAGLELRADYYRSLGVSTGARFEEIVEQNARQCDLRYGAPPARPGAPGPLAKLSRPDADGKVRESWNKLATNALNDIRKLDLKKVSAEGLESAFKGAFPKSSDVPEADRAKYNEAVGLLSKQLAQSVTALPVSEDLMRHVSGLIDDATRYVHSQITFSKQQGELKEEVRARGGLNPGEEAVAEASLAPVGAEVEKAKASLEQRLRTKVSHGVDADVGLDTKVLFLKNVKGKVAVEWEKGDFKAKVYANVRIDAPLTKDAKLTAEGGAEVQAGKFSASVHGKATVEKVWTDPVLGPTAEIDFRLGYDDPKVRAALTGKAIVPVGPGATQRSFELGASVGAGNWTGGANVKADVPLGSAATYTAGANVGYHKGNVGVTAGVGTTFGPGAGRPSTQATIGLSVHF